MRDGVDTNRFICTVAGVYLYFAMTGFCGSITPPTVFIPYLITIIYLLISELYAKSKDPINNWAYTMMTQMYIALPFSLLSVLAFRATPDGVAYAAQRFRFPVDKRYRSLLLRFALRTQQAVPAHQSGKELGRFCRRRCIRSSRICAYMASHGILWDKRPRSQHLRMDGSRTCSRGIRDMGRPRGKPLQTHTRGQGQRLNPAGPWRYARPVRLVIARHTRRCSISVYAHTVLITDRLYKK